MPFFVLRAEVRRICFWSKRIPRDTALLYAGQKALPPVGCHRNRLATGVARVEARVSCGAWEGGHSCPPLKARALQVRGHL